MEGAVERRRGVWSVKSGRHRRPTVSVTTVCVTALATMITRGVEAEETHPYIGCYVDTRDRVFPTQIAFKTSDYSLDACASACLLDSDPAWTYFGLEYGQECFCGNEYDTYGPADNCDMTYGESGVEAGGTWAISVYEIGAIDVNAVVGGSSSSMSSSSDGAGIGGDTDATQTTPVASGSRAFTVVNECSETIRIGSTGGRITFGSDADESSEELCDAWGASAVYNSGPMGIGCYWDLPDEASGNTDRMLAPGESFRYELHETDGDTRWSGTIWASTRCEEINGCATGVCYSPDTDYICPAYVGPGGPTTKAEFTLSDGGKDYYDVSAIDGVNLPMMIEPDNPIYPDNTTQTILKYECGSPGAPSSPTGLGDCDWSYDDYVPSIEENLRQYLRLVLPDSYEESVECTEDSDCSGDYICGVHPQRWANGAYKGGVLQGACGEHIAWVSAGGACAGGWTTDEFPDAFPFYCGESVPGGQRANMYGCYGGSLAHSGYTPGATNDSCGCPDWEGEDLVAPPISACNAENENWLNKAMPFAQHLKKACPTAYTFPYDDQTSTFACADMDDTDDDSINTQSYTITFCPGDTEENMYSEKFA